MGWYVSHTFAARPMNYLILFLHSRVFRPLLRRRIQCRIPGTGLTKGTQQLLKNNSVKWFSRLVKQSINRSLQSNQPTSWKTNQLLYPSILAPSLPTPLNHPLPLYLLLHSCIHSHSFIRPLNHEHINKLIDQRINYKITEKGKNQSICQSVSEWAKWSIGWMINFSIYNMRTNYTLISSKINPFTPKCDQVQICPAVSPEILHHTVWRTWFFIAH